MPIHLELHKMPVHRQKMPTNAAQMTMTNDELVEECCNNFYLVATLQGRVAYLLMSIHAVNPAIFGSDQNPGPILFANMLYGIGMNIYARPSMAVINPVNRFAFSMLGSMMFNHSSMLVYEWLVERFVGRPYLLTFLGFLCGRIMMVHLLAFLYHVDSRNTRRDPNYDPMYI